jgi:hypothetical protein
MTMDIQQELQKQLSNFGIIQSLDSSKEVVDFNLLTVEGISCSLNVCIKISDKPSFEGRSLFNSSYQRGLIKTGVYIEFLNSEIELRHIKSASFALISLLFNRKYSNFGILGIRILADASFLYFSLFNSEVQKDKDSLQGEIVAFFQNRGYGFILKKLENNETKKYFFHIDGVIDPVLVTELDASTQEGLSKDTVKAPSTIKNIPVIFYEGEALDKKYPKAVRITRGEGE